MDKKAQQAGWWTLILAGIAGAAYLPYRGSSGAPAAPSAVSAPAPGDASREAAPSDAVALLGQYFGIDVSEGGLKSALRNAVRNLKPDPAATITCPSEAPEARTPCHRLNLLQTFFADQRIDPNVPRLDQARKTSNAIAKCMEHAGPRPCASANDRATLTAFFRDYFDDEALRVANPPLEVRRVATDFSRVDQGALGLLEIEHAVRASGASLAFLVATVPDGVDSFQGWSFDPAVDAIRLAAERSGYVMDRFFVPDWSQRPSAGRAGGRVHEEQPGAMLFRSTKGTTTSLLMVLLALESPTGGVHAAAIDRALKLADWWKGPGSFSDVRIVGPYYSGTTESLRRALLRTMASSRSQVTVISGSATTFGNQAAIQSFNADIKVSFKAMTLPDNMGYLRQQLCDQFQIERMAWLVESNTVYGASGSTDLGCKGPDGANVKGNPTDVYYTFPLQISRLRDLTPSLPTDRQTTVGGPLIPLELREAFSPTDAFPSLSPALTSATVEMTVRNIARLIKREGIHVVGITATDARDKLFLARAIRQIHPSVVFVTTEANMLYTHPAYTDSVRGMLVASAYPLASIVRDPGAPVAFGSAAAEGIYNAALVQMNTAVIENGVTTSLVKRLDGEPLAVYGREPGGAARQSPSLWFALVGREDFWPVRRDRLAVPELRQNVDSYTFHIDSAPRPLQSAPSREESPRIHVGIKAAYCLFLGFVALHVFGFLTGKPWWMRRFSSRTGRVPAGLTLWQRVRIPFERGRRSTDQWIGPLMRKSQSGRYRRQLASFGALVVVLELSTVVQAEWAASVGGIVAHTVTVIAVALAAMLLGIILLLLWRIVSSLPILEGDVTSLWDRRVLYSGLMTTLSAACIVCCGWYVWELSLVPNAIPGAGGIALERFTRLSNGLSPLLPLGLIAAAVYLWGYVDLSGHPIPIHRRFDDALGTLNRLVYKREAFEQERKGLDKDRARVVTGRLLAVAVIASLGAWMLSARYVVGFEGPGFASTYIAAVLLVHALVAPKLIDVWYRWGILSRRLDELARHKDEFVKLLSPAPAESEGDKAKQPAEKEAGAPAAPTLDLPRLSPVLLFKGPGLVDVDRVYEVYLEAATSDPPVYGLCDTFSRAADLKRLVEYVPGLLKRWQIHTVQDERARALHPIVFFGLLDKHVYDNPFALTVRLAEQHVPAAVALADGVVDPAPAPADYAALGVYWDEALRGALPEGVSARDAIWWVALQPDALAIRGLVADLPFLPELVQRHLADEMERSPRMPASTSRAWDALARMAGFLAEAGVGKWAHWTTDSKRTAARFLALQLFTSIRIGLWQIWQALAFVMGAVLLLMLSHLVYPIQPRGLLVGVAAVEVLVAVVLAVRATFASERNPILNRFTGGTANQVDWSWAFAARLAAWAIVPIVGVLAARFPDVGDVILKLFSPFDSFLK